MKIIHFYTNLEIRFDNFSEKNIKTYKIFNLFNPQLDFFYSKSLLTLLINILSALHCIFISLSLPREFYLITCEAERPYFKIYYSLISIFRRVKLLVFLPGFLNNLNSYSYLSQKPLISLYTFQKSNEFKKEFDSKKINFSLFPRLWNNVELISLEKTNKKKLDSIVIISQYRDYLEKPEYMLNEYQIYLKNFLFKTCPELIKYLNNTSIPITYLPAYKDKNSKQSEMEESFFLRLNDNILIEKKLNPYLKINPNSLYISFNSTLSIEYSFLSIASLTLDNGIKSSRKFSSKNPSLILDFFYKYKFNKNIFLERKKELLFIKKGIIKNINQYNFK